MACPKKKTSHRKQHQRRAKWVAILPNITKCSNCGESAISHNACTSCGFYNGREYIKSLPRKKRKATA
ncbi:MAG: 50S ribosomal protein L32 [Candidatus Melainabacteria bacterium RIFCSPHIGHO2_02_FULL_34_12]|nr:MAG: 50S ribosomal protein L32 [Candidatus Melainabacteria bacterium RIFCSPHIGHO2_02_FULL_34_12]